MRLKLFESLHHLLADEERVANVFIWGASAVCAVAFGAAVVAMVVMR